MDPFTIALATFGVQKLRGKSTKRSLRDALMLGGLGQLGAMGGVPGLQGFGQIGAGALQGGTLGAQLGQTSVMQGLGSLFPQMGGAGFAPDPNQLTMAQKAAEASGAMSGGASEGLSRFLPKTTAGKIGLTAAAIPLFSGLFGGDDPEKQYLPIPNQAYSKFAKSGHPGTPTGFKTRDYTTGQDVALEDPATYQTVEDILGSEPTQQYKAVEMNQGGIVNILKFNEGGQVLPSKFTHDENDVNNYQRANGFVMDGTGNGKDHEDTMLAQLADGEFVSRSHAVLGAGIIAGASINDKSEQRKKGAKFFYDQQKQFKRIFDLLNANKTQH